MNENLDIFMQRCLELAENGSGKVAPNPMVGAVLVHENRIVGEGYHAIFGGPHAEVNAIRDAIEKGNKNILPECVLFVSLEPCTHFGKTPPCSDLIIENKISHVIIGCQDPYREVNGKGVKKLKEAGIRVEVGILEEKCKELNRRFFTFHVKKRPYVILKYAQTADGFISPSVNANKKISNGYTDRLVHKWRSEESAILVGTRTAENDNPSLTVRKWVGKNPIRIVIDKDLRLNKSLNLFDDSAPTIVINSKTDSQEKNIELIRIPFSENITGDLLSRLYERKILSVLVEGGKSILDQFIESKSWDEARIITSPIRFAGGIPAPEIHGRLISQTQETGDTIESIVPD